MHTKNYTTGWFTQVFLMVNARELKLISLAFEMKPGNHKIYRMHLLGKTHILQVNMKGNLKSGRKRKTAKRCVDVSELR